MKTRKLIVTAILSLILSAGFAVAPSAMAQEPYNLGVILDLSTSGAAYCKDGVDAVQLAVDEINSQGGFLGKHPIKLFIRDDASKPETAVREAKDLIENHQVRCILATYSSACAVPIKPVCRDAKVLHIAAISNSENITKLDFSPYTYSVVPNSYMQAMAVVLGVERMGKRYGWKQYMTIASDYEWGRSTQANSVKLLKEVAPEIALKKEFWPPLGEKNFEPAIVEMVQAKPNFVYGCLPGDDNAAWMEQAKKYNYSKQYRIPGH